MNYFKIVFPRVIDTSVIRQRPDVPAHCTKLYRTSLNFDISSDQDNNRAEYWESSQGTLTEAQVIAEVYGGVSEIDAIGFKYLEAQETILFDNQTCVMLEVLLNNITPTTKIVQMQIAASGEVLEELNLAIDQIIRVVVPKPFNRYKLQVPAGVLVSLNRYVL